MFETGFLGTKASFYMDLSTIYFALLPFLLIIAIRYARQKAYQKHLYSQLLIFIMTMIVIVIFEVGIRLESGFLEFSKNSSIPFSFLLPFLFIHIMIAVITVLAWIYLLISSFRNFKNNSFGSPDMALSHKRVGKWVFIGLSLSAFMGVTLYILLFIL